MTCGECLMDDDIDNSFLLSFVYGVNEDKDAYV